MRGYLGNVRYLLSQVPMSVPEGEVQQAMVTLGQSPVPSYSPFTEDEVRVLGAYREYLVPRSQTNRTDFIWQDILAGEWYAWIYAIHEMEEIAAFERRGINPFDRVQWKLHLSGPHTDALVAELWFLRAWATHLGEDVPEMALLQEHLLRRGMGQKLQEDMNAVRQREGWSNPTIAELQAAQRFWAKRGQP